MEISKKHSITLHQHETIVGRKIKTNKADRYNEITCADKSNSIENQLKIMYYVKKILQSIIKLLNYK